MNPICQNYYCVYASHGTNLMHYVPSVYSDTVPLHVSGWLIAHHQEVTIHICNKWYVMYVPVVPFVAYIHCYLLMMGN
jgi:hypothetical protein